MSAGALDPSLSNRGTNTRVVFFNRAVYAFKRAERESGREFASYAPIGHILQGFAAASVSLDEKLSVFLDIQPYLKGPDDAGCSPDFTAMLIPVCKITDRDSDSLPKNILIFIWEVKALDADDWFAVNLDFATSQAQLQFKSYLRQLSGQALFAFHQYEGDTIPVFLSQGNSFTMLLYDRPPSWDTIAVKYADTLKRGPRQPTATGQPKPESSRATTTQQQEAHLRPQAQEAPSGQQEELGVQGHSPESAQLATDQAAGMPGRNASPDTDGRGPTNPVDEAVTGNAENISTGTPDASAESAGPAFEDGDYPIPRLYCSAEDILSRDGLGFSPQYIKAMNIAMKMRGVAFDAQDHIFRLPDGMQLDDIHPVQSLETAQAAIDAFKLEQDNSKLADQTMTTNSSASVHSEYKNPRTAVVRPLNGKLWNLRRRQIKYTSPKAQRKVANRDFLRRLVAETSGHKRARSSQKTVLDQSQNVTTAHAHVNAVAGPSNARAVPLRPLAYTGTRGAGPSKKRAFDQVQDELVAPAEVAGPSKKQGAGPRGRPVQPAAQDASSSKKRKLESSGDSPEADAHVDEAAADPSNEEVTGHSAEASTGNTKKPGQASRKGKERAH